jgi:hypothetical protein
MGGRTSTKAGDFVAADLNSVLGKNINKTNSNKINNS